MIIASSKNDKCMEQLFAILEIAYPEIEFDLNISYTSTIKIKNEKGIDTVVMECLSCYCAGYVGGWEDADDNR